jgi:hypothetical protein
MSSFYNFTQFPNISFVSNVSSFFSNASEILSSNASVLVNNVSNIFVNEAPNLPSSGCLDRLAELAHSFSWESLKQFFADYPWITFSAISLSIPTVVLTSILLWKCFDKGCRADAPPLVSVQLIKANENDNDNEIISEGETSSLNSSSNSSISLTSFNGFQS